MPQFGYGFDHSFSANLKIALLAWNTRETQQTMYQMYENLSEWTLKNLPCLLMVCWHSAIYHGYVHDRAQIKYHPHDKSSVEYGAIQLVL